MSLVPLIVVVPFVAAALGLTLARHRLLAQRVAVGGSALTLALALAGAVLVWPAEAAVVRWGTIPTGWVPIEIATRADPLGLTAAVMVATVALAVQVYSTSYLGRDPRYASYAALVSLLTAAMLLVVLADDLLVLFVGWQVMGVCSSLLIGHRWELPQARSAAVKAFVVPHLGDVSLLVGVLVLADLAGSFRLSVITAAVEPSTTLTVALVLVLAGVAGKSAQVPLHVWLPAATVGPPPVSALIQAAAMVAAGVVLVARLHDAYLRAPAAMAVLAVMASVTMVLGALAALAQDDVKRVLAWSTSSQLAYMLGALAVGGYSAGLFHLLGHAAFKALLFLAAGAIAYAVGTTLLSQLGGLRLSMRRTYLVTTVGLAAMVGLPPFVGFFSGESVLAAAGTAARTGGPLPGWAAWLVLFSALVTTLLTAAYATRVWLLAFHGPPRMGTAHDPPPAMRAPLVGLVVPAVALGAVAFALPTILDQGAPADGVALHAPTTLLSLVLIAAGGFAAYSVWMREHQTDPAAVLAGARPVLAAGLGFDAAYQAAVVRPTYWLGRLAVAGDRDVIHPYVVAAGRLVRALGALPHAAQTGRVQSYLTAVLAFVVVLAVAAAGVVL